MSIGERAAQAVFERAIAEGTSVAEQYEKLKLARAVQHHWETERNDPSAYALRQLALAGYDVVWILTGGDRSG